VHEHDEWISHDLEALERRLYDYARETREQADIAKVLTFDEARPATLETLGLLCRAKLAALCAILLVKPPVAGNAPVLYPASDRQLRARTGISDGSWAWSSS
jgi:hypothetical protein